MRNLLTKHGIPTLNLAAAVDFLTDAPASAVWAFNKEFGLTPNRDDAVAVACFVADAIFRGATTVDKVVGYASKRMLGQAPQPAVSNAPVLVVGVPVVDNAEVTVTPVVVESATPMVRVPGKRGRKRLGNSDFAKAVNVIQTAAPGASRDTLLNCIVAQGIKETSAAVYLWRYNKGERE